MSKRMIPVYCDQTFVTCGNVTQTCVPIRFPRLSFPIIKSFIYRLYPTLTPKKEQAWQIRPKSWIRSL